MPLKWGKTSNGFVHACNEFSVSTLFQVLDTITDFVDFLCASEGLVREGVSTLFSGGGIEDLVALYIQQGRSFQFDAFDGKQPDLLILHSDLWQGLVKSESFKSMQSDLKDSYVWDNLIELYTDDLLAGGMLPEWTEKNEHDVQGIQRDLGYFENVSWNKCP